MDHTPADSSRTVSARDSTDLSAYADDVELRVIFGKLYAMLREDMRKYRRMQREAAEAAENSLAAE